MTLKFTVLWEVTSYCLATIYRHIGVTGCLQQGGKSVVVYRLQSTVLETKHADGQTDTTSLHAFALYKECTPAINERSIK